MSAGNDTNKELSLGDAAQLPEAAPPKAGTSRHLGYCALSMIGILACTIVLAIVWMGMDGEGGWQEQYEYVERPGLHRFATCLHWAISQFTFTSMEIVPQTDAERTVAFVVPLLSLGTVVPLVGCAVLSVGRCGIFPPSNASKKASALRMVILYCVLLVCLLVVAAIWDSLGSADPDAGDVTWKLFHGFTDERSGENDSRNSFIVSLHWTIAQFTFCSMEVVPTNVGERLFTVLIQLVGIGTFWPVVVGIVLCSLQLIGFSNR